MKAEFESLALTKNNDEMRFELTVDGHTAFIDFKERNAVISLIHTESPPELAGRGVATALIEKTLAYLDEHAYQLKPYCPLVFAYIQRHGEWVRIVHDDFKEKFSA